MPVAPGIPSWRKSRSRAGLRRARWGPWIGFGGEATSALSRVLVAWVGIHGLFTLLEGRMAPAKREEEYERVHKLVVDGPFARRHWLVGVGLGIVLPLLLLALPESDFDTPLAMVAALCALIGLYSEEDLLVRAGQALPIS